MAERPAGQLPVIGPRGRRRLAGVRVRLGPLALSLGIALIPGAAEPEGAADAPLAAVVRLKSYVPEDARTASFLGTEREGSGVVIDSSGLILTIGYLILEAMAAEVTDQAGNTVTARVLAYDHETGFGLLRASRPINAAPATLGSAAGLSVRDRVLVVAHDSQGGAQEALVVARRVFAGPWEYLLENAVFTSPPHRGFGGAALIDQTGKLVGVGSLFVQEAFRLDEGTPVPGNMFVPIDLLKPILADLRDTGRSRGPRRPWLGVRAQELLGRLFVQRVAPDSPAETAGIVPGDIVIAVAGVPLAGTLADFYRKVWALGDAGVAVPLTVLHGNVVRDVTLRSRDRYEYLRLNPSL